MQSGVRLFSALARGSSLLHRRPRCPPFRTFRPLADKGNGKSPSRDRDPSYMKNAPAERFDPTWTLHDWEQLFHQLLKQPTRPWTFAELERGEEAIRFWTFHRTPNAVDRSIQLFRQLAIQVDQNPNLLGNVAYWNVGNFPRVRHLLNAILDSWRIVWTNNNVASVHDETSSIMTPQQALDFLDEMEALQIPLDCRAYTSILQAAVARNTANEDAAVFGEHVLTTMIQKGMDNNNENAACLPDTVALAVALNAWAKSSHSDATERALRLWQEIHHLLQHQVLHCPVNTVCYNAILECLTKCNNNQQAEAELEQAEEVLHSMKESEADTMPNTTSYQLVLFGWVRLATINSKNNNNNNGSRALRQRALDRAFLLLQEAAQVRHDGQPVIQISFFSILLTTLLRNRPTAPDQARAQQVYELLMDLKQQEGTDYHLSFDHHTLKAILLLHCKQNRPAQASTILTEIEATQELPKRGHYREVIQAWIRSPSAESASETDRWLSRMLQLAQEHKCSYAPDSALMDSALKKVSRHSAARTESLFRAYQDLNGDVWPSHFLRVMYAHAAHARKTNQQSSRERLLMWWDDLRAWCQTHKYTLNRFDRTAALSALPEDYWTPERLDEMIEFALSDNNNEKCRPDTALYQAVLKACRIAGDGDRAQSVFLACLADYDSQNENNQRLQITPRLLNMTLAAYLGDPLAPNKVPPFVKRIGGHANQLIDDKTRELLELNLSGKPPTILKRSRGSSRKSSSIRRS